MSGLDKNRKRPYTIAFRMSPDEKNELYYRIKVSGMPRGQFMIESVLHSKVEITAGKFKSDRLSLEIKRLRERLEEANTNEESKEVLIDCRTLLKQVINICEEGD